MVIIGVDPHPSSHTIAVMDETGGVLRTLTVENTPDGVKEILELGRGYPKRSWAIEGAGNGFVTPLVRDLLASGEEVTNIPPAVTSQYRSRRGRKKNDEVDAANIARALLANPELPTFDRDETVETLKRHTRTRQRLVGKLQSERMALKDLPAASPIRPSIESVIRALEEAIAAISVRIEKIVKSLNPDFLDVKGVGPVVAGVVLAETGDIQRFRNADAFAAYCGVAPVERSSGKMKRVQVNTGGNRRLNYALHIAALVRMRTHPETRAYIERKVADGKTKRAAIRQLKTAIARRFYKSLRDTTHQIGQPKTAQA